MHSHAFLVTLVMIVVTSALISAITWIGMGGPCQ